MAIARVSVAEAAVASLVVLLTLAWISLLVVWFSRNEAGAETAADNMERDERLKFFSFPQ